MKKLLSASLLALSLAAPAMADQQIKAVASFSILADLVEQVCAHKCQVTTIAGPDTDAHVYEPTAADAIAVAQADIIFVNALGFETWSADLINNSGTKAETINVNANAEVLMVEGTADPHAWNDPSNVVSMLDIIAQSLGEQAPASAQTFKLNAAAYAEAVSSLVAGFTERLATLPADRRTVVTAHDAFGYLGRAMGLTFLAPIGIDGEGEPSAFELVQLIEQIKQVGAAALFVENINNPDLVQQIAKETGLSIGGQLFSDALSEKGSPATSYLTMLEHNLTAILTELEK